MIHYTSRLLNLLNLCEPQVRRQVQVRKISHPNRTCRFEVRAKHPQTWTKLDCGQSTKQRTISFTMNGCRQIQSLSSNWLQVAKVIDCGYRQISILSNWLWGCIDCTQISACRVRQQSMDCSRNNQLQSKGAVKSAAGKLKA